MNTLFEDIREMVHEQLQYRELLYQMTRRDLMLRYKQTVMGFGWAIFSPLVNTLIFSVVFTRVAPLDVGVPYPVFSYAGLLAWNFFSASLRFSVTSLTSNTNLVAKVFFPREIFPFSNVIVAAVDFLVGALLLVAMMVYYRIEPSWQLVFFPLVFLVQLVFTAAIALLLSMGNLFFRDVKYLFDVVVTVWMFASSVLYPMPRIDGPLGMVLRLNPMTAVIDAYRSMLFGGASPDYQFLAIIACGAFALLGFSWLVFHRAEFQFAERI